MCELLGLSSRKKITVNSYLREFFSHSEIHCHGWGLALFYQQAVSLEKEAIAANQSQYLHQRIDRGTLHLLRKDAETVWIATKPLDDGPWEAVPFLQLLVFREGRLVYEGKGGSQE